MNPLARYKQNDRRFWGAAIWSVVFWIGSAVVDERTFPGVIKAAAFDLIGWIAWGFQLFFLFRSRRLRRLIFPKLKSTPAGQVKVEEKPK